jgi:hypothetical protein
MTSPRIASLDAKIALVALRANSEESAATLLASLIRFRAILAKRG